VDLDKTPFFQPLSVNEETAGNGDAAEDTQKASCLVASFIREL
jgi:hypothetical protein